ncbi:MAG: hypothetical protein KDI69_01040 [Xanthomonadales bacterium]|nr:hypothetical protein [Xanthomonadales bacterium]
MRSRYFISLPEPSTARGSDPDLSSTANGAEAFARDVQQVLSSTHAFDRWRAKQSAPDDVDPGLGGIDLEAKVTGSQADLGIDLVIETALASNILQQRLRWLFGNGWRLRDVAQI